jgi:hypothetical protein
MQPLPLARVKTVLDRAPPQTALEGLGTADQASLLGHEASEFGFFV